MIRRSSGVVSITLGEIARRLGLPLAGDGEAMIQGVASLDKAQHGDITFISNRRLKGKLRESGASALIVTAELKDLFSGNTLLSSNPQADFARVIDLLFPVERTTGVHPTAVIDPSATLHESVYVGPHTVIEHDVTVEEDCSIGPNCILGAGSRLGAGGCLKANVSIADNVKIGKRVLVHQGAVIGSDGFGLVREGAAWLKIPQIGGVVIGEDVEIGANTTIDRGALEDTILEDGVKLDNLIQVAHNVRIGANTAIAACVGIAGSARIGRNCTIGGAAVVLGHLKIVDDVHITAMSLVTKSIDEPGVYSSGTPLEPNASWHRNYVRFKQLDEMAKRIRALEDEQKSSGQR